MEMSDNKIYWRLPDGRLMEWDGKKPPKLLWHFHSPECYKTGICKCKPKTKLERGK